MSDIINTGRTEETSTDLDASNQSVGHSGDLGLEFPQEKHLELTGKTPLDKVAGLLHTPKSPADLERKPRLKPTLKQKIGGAIAAVSLIAGGAVIGSAVSKSGEEAPSQEAEDVAQPLPEDLIPENVEVVETPEIPAEAQQFVDMFGDRYGDPVSVFYAEQSYKTNHGGLGTVLDEQWVAERGIDDFVTGEESELYELKSIKFPPGTPANNETYMNLVNEAAFPNLERYMNLVAANPTPELVAFIDNEFVKYVSPNHSRVYELLGLMSGVVAQFGPTATYEIAPVTNDTANRAASTLPDEYTLSIDSVDGDGNLLAFSNTIDRMVIYVEAFKGAEPVQHVVVLEDVQLGFQYNPITGPVEGNPGYMSIGMQ